MMKPFYNSKSLPENRKGGFKNCRCKDGVVVITREGRDSLKTNSTQMTIN